MQIFFLSLVSAAAGLFVPSSWPFLTVFQRFMVLALVPQPYVWTLLCNRSTPNSPHIITHASHADNMVQYPYDYKLFHPNVVCRTCNFIKPARSKHCSLCQACVARSDHHCIWVNNCVGRGNYKYFLGLLAGTSALLSYGAWLAYSTLKPQVEAHWRTYPDWHVPTPGSPQFLAENEGKGTLGFAMARGEYYLDVLATALIEGGVGRGGVGLLCFLTAALPASLFGYHMYLIWLGATTNESGKWSDWKEDIGDNLAYTAPLLGNEVADPNRSYGNGHDSQHDGITERKIHHHTISAPVNAYTGEMPNVHQHQAPQPQDNWPSYQPPTLTIDRNSDSADMDSPSNPDPNANDSSWRWSAWPKRATQFMVCTSDGHTPRLLQPHITRIVGTEPAWRRVRSLNEVENIYDLGFWRNFKDLVTN
jgi:palmitoyltransferase ZDHHC4